MKEIELINKRKLREKHFLREDGTIVAKVYNEDIHYLKNGKYEDIDNTLVKENDCYCNRSNDYKVRFKNNSNASLMRMEKDENYLDIKLKESHISNLLRKNKKSKLIEDILYKEILDDIDIEYKTLPTKVKETIILKSNNCRKLIFIINTNLKLEQKNSYILAKKDEKVIFTIDPPFMEDSSGNINENVIYNLKVENGAYELELILDSEWLSSKEIKFPVYIDPTITNINQSTGLYDTFIYPNDSNDTDVNRGSASMLKAGVEKVNGVERVNRTLIKFDLPELGTGSEIISADLELVPYPSTNNNHNAKSRLVTVHRVTEEWNEENATWNNMNNKYDQRVEAVFECERSYVENSTIIARILGGDITALVKKWYKDMPNYGLLIKSAEEKYIDDDFPAYFSKDNTITGDNNPKPIFILTYKNQNGIEDYLDYKEQHFTNGTTYINTYNGNMTAIFDIGHTIGGQFPANIDLVYNSNDVILNKITPFGKGFRLNVNQTIREINISGVDYLEYVDEDGTIHYFYKHDDEETSKYIDEDGLNLTIKKSGLDYVLEDNVGTKLTFVNKNNIFYLSEVLDASGNVITILYDSENRVSNVTDSYNGTIVFSYATDLITVTSSDFSVKLNYEENHLMSIVTIDGTTSFEYNSNDLISEILDINGLKIKYEYYTEKPYKMKKVTQYGINNTIGQWFTLNYGFETTTITDNLDKVETIIYNHNGNVISKNSLKSADNIEDAYSIMDVYGDDVENKNKLLTECIPVTHIKNYLKNTSFETEDIYFSSNINENIQITEEYAVSGKKSLKFISNNENDYIEQEVNIPKGEYYTFSGYFKADKKITITLYYSDGDNTIVENQTINSSEEFERDDVTIYYSENANSNLKIKISLLPNTILYMDNIQLERGEVANLYNMIENSDFSEGYSDWNLEAIGENQTQKNITDYFEIVKFNNNKNSALKIKMDPQTTTRFKKTFFINGKAGDLYTVSFWYKNEGVPACRQYAGNNVTIYYHPIDDEADYCILSSEDFNSNEGIWQYFTYRYSALEDFDKLELIFNQNTQANNLYITNISLYKEITSGDYKYNNNGNIISITNQSKEIQAFKYDKNNKLIQETTPRGKQYKYEYDNIKTDRILSAISSSGISNRIKYDNNGNPIATIISKKSNGTLLDGKYRIRCKGTSNYIKAKYREILVESNECSNTVWNLEVNENGCKFIHSIIPEFSLSYHDDIICITDDNTNNTFILEENENGSYYIAFYIDGTKRYLKANNSMLVLDILEIGNSAFEFYIEPIYNEFIERNAYYTENGKFLNKIVNDDLSQTTFITDNNKGTISSKTEGNEIVTTYTYDSKNQIKSLSIDNRTVTYNYNNNNKLNKIEQGNKNYELIYDNFLNLSSVKLNNNSLFTNEYAQNNGNMLSTTYGNNQQISYEYDDFERVKKLITQDNAYNYKYDNNGNLAKIISNNNVQKYKYDLSNRLYDYKNGNFKTSYTYDSDNNITSKKYTLDGLTNQLDYDYDNGDNVTNIIFDTDNIYYNYDFLGNIISKKINNLYSTSYEYVSNGKRKAELIKSITNNLNKYEYKYDEMNNVTHIYLNNELIVKYYYDNINELIKEENFKTNTKINYYYDEYGNITSTKIADMSTNEVLTEHTYLYQNPNWEDQLTSYNGQEITYDEIGNPKSIGNYITMNWINGKSLYQYVDNANNLNITYQYNENGIRTTKIVNGNKTNYYLENNNIIYEQNTNRTLYYLYDLTGVCGIRYNGNIYHFIKNLQNDIIGILNDDYEQIVSYEYNSWGEILGIKDAFGNEITDVNNIGLINPFRYRGYYYDSETKLYYLNNRYYNPQWGRFLNTDGILGINEDILSYNLYNYASNNPIVYSDESGLGIFNSIKNVFNKVSNTVNKIVNTIKNNYNSNSNKSKSVSQSKSNSGNNGNKNKLPIVGPPNSVLQNPLGNKRVYGPDGKALKDIDSAHPNNHPELKNPHEHDWTWDKNGKPHRGKAHNFAETATDVTIAVGAGYLIYRGIRMLPSLIPGFWWTIPVNAATP